jgi:hypothetical protein
MAILPEVPLLVKAAIAGYLQPKLAKTSRDF